MASDTDRTGLDTWESPLPSLFWRINDVDQHSAIRLFQRRTLAASEVLCKEGTPADTLIVVENGLIEVTVGGSHIADVGPESLVGETALFEDAVRGATLRARVKPLVSPALWRALVALRGDRRLGGPLKELDALLGRMIPATPRQHEHWMSQVRLARTAIIAP